MPTQNDLQDNAKSAIDEKRGPDLLASHYIPMPATFRFDLCGKRFDAAIRSHKDGGAELVVRGTLGRIPFSAESAEARRHVQSLVDAAQLIEDTKVSVDKSQVVFARRIMSFKSKPPPSYVAAGTAVMAISLKPLCEAMERRLKVVENASADTPEDNQAVN